MRKPSLAAALAITILSGCATNQPYGYGNGYYDQYGNYQPYGYQPNPNNNQTGNVVAGAAVGAVGGAIVGKATGVGVVPGAVAGAVLGGVIGASINGRQYYRDTRGYCYYVDQYGQPHYSYDIRC